jgi:hypothetical protein
MKHVVLDDILCKSDISLGWYQFGENKQIRCLKFMTMACQPSDINHACMTDVSFLHKLLTCLLSCLCNGNNLNGIRHIPSLRHRPSSIPRIEDGL